MSFVGNRSKIIMEMKRGIPSYSYQNFINGHLNEIVKSVCMYFVFNFYQLLQSVVHP